MNNYFHDYLEEQKKNAALRTLKPISSRSGTSIIINGKSYIDLSSNDYLGLSSHPEMIKTSKEAADKYGCGSGGSRLLSGDRDIFHELEQKVAVFKEKEAALVFNSGYQVNVGVIPALCAKGDAVFADKLVHASLIDGILLSGARLFRFKHNDTEDLRALLEKNRGSFKKGIIVTESVFSMDGDIAPLVELSVLKVKHDCLLMVDEAHATGIFGNRGSGMAEEAGVSKSIDIIMGTFSKALGSCGAYIACSEVMKQYLINTCRSFIYSTALPPSIAAVNIKAIELIKKEPERRKNLLSLSEKFRVMIKDAGYAPMGESQIIPVMIGDNREAVALSEKLRDSGMWVLPIDIDRSKGQARIRFSLSCRHTDEVLNTVMKILKTANA